MTVAHSLVASAGLGVAVLFLGLSFRLAMAFVVVLRSDLNLRERLFIPISWCPKATVQVRTLAFSQPFTELQGLWALAFSQLFTEVQGLWALAFSQPFTEVHGLRALAFSKPFTELQGLWVLAFSQPFTEVHGLRALAFSQPFTEVQGL